MTSVFRIVLFTICINFDIFLFFKKKKIGFKQKTAAEEFDFPIPLDESSKTTKGMKKVCCSKGESTVFRVRPPL